MKLVNITPTFYTSTSTTTTSTSLYNIMELPEIGLLEALIGIACLLLTRKILQILQARNQARQSDETIIVQVQATLTPTLAPAPLIKRHGEDEDYETASDDGSDNDENFDPYRDFKRKLRYRSVLENKTK